MIELLRLADSRIVFIGGLAVDTVCLGTLALFLTNPEFVTTGGAGNVVLLSLAITAPVLALSAGILHSAIPKGLSGDEVARRMVMAGAVLHGGIQLSVLLGLACGRGSSSTLGYFLSTFLLTAIFSVSMVPVGHFVRWLKEVRAKRQTVQVSPDIASTKL